MTTEIKPTVTDEELHLATQRFVLIFMKEHPGQIVNTYNLRWFTRKHLEAMKEKDDVIKSQRLLIDEQISAIEMLTPKIKIAVEALEWVAGYVQDIDSISSVILNRTNEALAAIKSSGKEAASTLQ